MAGAKLARVAVVGVLVASFLPGCGRLRFDATDAAPAVDSSMADASTTDASIADATTTDATTTDATTTDATTGDGAITDSGLDAGVDAGLDAGVDAGLDAGVDAGLDAGVDAGGCALPGCGCTRVVDPSSVASTPDGMSWATAFTTLQPAIDAASATALAMGGNTACEVWVKAGRYFVFQGSTSDTITMRPRVNLFGGFLGSEVDGTARNAATNVTILDGHNSANTQRVLHVVTGAGLARIDGFTITGGRAAGNKGGGLISSGAAAPLVVDCTFENNDAPGSVNARGGGAAFIGTGRGILRGCRFVNNNAERGGGLYVENGSVSVFDTSFETNVTTGTGGAIYVRLAELEVAGSRFTGNQANLNGGAIASEGNNTHSLRIERSRFDANITGGSGGAIWVDSEPLELENVVVSANTAGGNGGGVGFTNPQLADINGVTIGNNTAGGNGAGLHAACPQQLCSIKNSILWNPGTASELSVSGMTFFARNIVRGGAPAGMFNINADPMFVTMPMDFTPGPTSPAIDAADGCEAPLRDLDGAQRIDNSTIANTGLGPPSDIGAIERQAGGVAAPVDPCQMP